MENKKIIQNSDLERASIQQTIFYELFEGSKKVFLTGGAGTGKSHIIRELSKESQPILTSTTGVSAVNIGGQTVHSFFKLGISSSLDELKSSDRTTLKKFRMRTIYRYLAKMTRALKGADFLIIDEVSMLNKNILEMIQYRLNQVQSQDIPILFTGDLLQLPPVEGETILKSEFFREATVFNLNKIYRTTDPDFIEFSSRVRFGDNKTIREYLESKKYRGQPMDNYVQIYPTIKEVQSQNEAKLEELDTEARVYTPKVNKKGNKVNDREIDTFMNNAKIIQELTLKVGAQIIITRNCVCDDYVNGDVAIVEELLEDKIVVRLIRDGLPRVLEYAEFENIEFSGNGSEMEKKVKWVVMALPVMLGWAITIHKSQGASIDKLYIRTNNLFAQSQFYVAISRSSNPDNLIIDYGDSPDGLLEIIPWINQEAKEFYEKLPDENQYF
jgi:ATP-dependent exoDNAse (exonuclease V) alpha subunit